MRSSTKLILIVAVILGVAALSAGIAVAAGGGGTQTGPAVVSEGPGDDGNGAAETDDDAAEGAEDSEGPGDDENGTGETNDRAESADESDASLTGETATKAADAALAATGGGTLLTAEPDDGNAGYEVEIRKTDGSEAEVELDKNFKVVQRAEDD